MNKMNELDYPSDVTEELKDLLPTELYNNICLVESHYKVEGFNRYDEGISVNTNNFYGYVSIENGMITGCSIVNIHTNKEYNV